MTDVNDYWGLWKVVSGYQRDYILYIECWSLMKLIENEFGNPRARGIAHRYIFIHAYINRNIFHK